MLQSLAGDTFSHLQNSVIEVEDSTALSYCYHGAAEPVGEKAIAAYATYKEEKDALRVEEMEAKHAEEEELLALNPETLKAKSDELKAKEDELTEKETLLATFSEELEAKEVELTDKETLLTAKSEELDAREAKLKEREVPIAPVKK